MDPDGLDSRKAAFPGASFTIHGCCINHREYQVCKPVSTGGRTKYGEMRLCPKCVGGLNEIVPRKRSSNKKQVHPVDSNPPTKASSTPNDTPFDTKGRCHHHKDVQLATKQMGEWKVLLDSCPMCREEAIARSESSKARKQGERKCVVQYDGDGYCVNHPDVKVAKKKVTGSWKVTNECLKCASRDDSASVYSTQTKDSRATSCSAKSNKSTRSRGSRRSREDDVSLVMQDGRATQAQSHWSNVSSSKQSKRKPKGIKRFLLTSVAM